MKATRDDKARGYRRVAERAIDYVYLCAEKGVAPLMHDAHLLSGALAKLDAMEVAR